MMREALDQWDFVVAAYAVGIVGTLARHKKLPRILNWD